MLFNSVDFAIFLPVFFILYWFVTNRSLKAQNILIVLGSYFFYGWWDWRFLSLILFSTLVDFLVGIQLGTANEKPKRKILLWTSILVNLGFLGFFKYYNFFLDNFTTAFSFFGNEISASSLNIVLPVGISFYTFQSLSYTIDVYRKNLDPTKDFFAFAAFVCFFPQLVAGPIERATRLLSQFSARRTFDYSKAVDGLRQILWGLFKKVVIADNCAEFANMIFQNSADHSGFTLLLGALFFTFQIYCDFSGYSDIAIGTARLFGFDLMKNFAFPYFSRDIAEFWRRWHISLSTWFRDYLYIPLGGSRGGNWMRVRNTFAIFIVSGFWHGANWTFIVWGALNAIYFLPLLLRNKNRRYLGVIAQGKYFPSISELFNMTLTFLLTVFAWIFFRANDLEHAFTYIMDMFSGMLQLNSISESMTMVREQVGMSVMGLIFLFLVIEWIGREGEYAIESIGAKWNRAVRWVFYYAIVLCILMYAGDQQEFIYFQF